MRILILFILISFLGDIGKAVQIKVHGQPKHEKKRLSEVLAEVLDDVSPKPSTQRAQVLQVSAKDYREELEGINAKAIMEGDAKAIVKGISSATSLITSVLENKELTDGLAKLAKGLKLLAFAGPVASIALDLFLGAQPNPELEAISNKLDGLSNKLDKYHGESMQAIKGLGAEICESAFSTQRSTLDTLNKFMMESKREYSPFVLFQVCGPYLSTCFSAFTTIALNFPPCLDKIIEGSDFTGEKNLRIGGNKEKVDPKINSYISLMSVSYRNFGTLMGKYYVEDLSKENPLTDRELYDLKLASEFLNNRMQHMLEEIHKRLPQLTDYKVFDWGALGFGTGPRYTQKTFRVDWDYAIMGFYRERGEQLIDVKYVLGGKGVLRHGGVAWTYTADFKEYLKDKPAGSQQWERTATCSPHYHLRGFTVNPRFHDSQWLEDLEGGECITTETQNANDGDWAYWDEDCYTQPEKWEEFHTWHTCSKLGYYISGIERGAGANPGLDGIAAFKCCRAKMMALGHRRVD